MKTLLPFLFITSAILLSIEMRKHNHTSSKKEPIGFSADSGYIQKEDAIKLLSQVKYDTDTTVTKDSIDMDLYDIKTTDTIGKFYRMENGNYLAFVYDVIHPDRYLYMLLESTPNGTVLKSEPYWSGMHQCCWENGSLGFKKYANGYFGTQSCGTGSGHCSSYIYLFKNFTPQGHGICSYIWTGWCVGGEIACNLTSDMKIKNDTVTMHYTMQHLKERRNGKYKVIDEEKFDIKYVAHKQVWIALDSTKIREFPD